nr:zinc ribbon domain-containing protein [uncultured Methanobrevibacter sp.]
MVKCQNCGSEMEEGAKFCRNCGSEIAAETETNVKYCRKCGFELPDENIKFCPSCGASTSSELQEIAADLVLNAHKNPILAAILSFFIIGLGQIYIGLTKKGIILFVSAIVCGILGLIIIGWILWIIVWIYGIYDAYNSANKMSMGIGVKDTIDFNDL